MIYTSRFDSPVGNILIAEKNEGLTGLWIKDQKYFMSSINEEISDFETPLLASVKSWLFKYFSGDRPPISQINLSPSGSEFRLEVWKILCKIPYGETITYGEIAKKMALITGREKMSPQAVGGALSHNPISIIIPCHRVVGSNLSLTGYAGGIDTKIKLLSHEGVDTGRFSVPKSLR